MENMARQTLVNNIQTDAMNVMTTNADHYEEDFKIPKKFSQQHTSCQEYEEYEGEEDNPNNQALISMRKDRLSSEQIEVLEIDDATNFHQFLLNQIMINRQQ